MISIGAVALQTGIQVETLRKWEARYGFPVPTRSAGGQRLYRDDDLSMLHRVARAISAGQRAGSAIRSLQEAGSDETSLLQHDSHTNRIQQAVTLLQSNDLAGYEKFVEDELIRLGLFRFCLDFALPLTTQVGESWQRGALPVYAEHIFSRHLHALLARKSPVHTKGRAGSPNFLLALPAGENHGLAVAIFNALLQEAGFATVLLLNGLPAGEIAEAALAYQVDVVALSCSLACGKRVLHDELTALRRYLPSDIAMWVGGSGALRLPAPVPGVEYFQSMEVAIASARALQLPARAGVL